jgi:hypothetical protein
MITRLPSASLFELIMFTTLFFGMAIFAAFGFYFHIEGNDIAANAYGAASSTYFLFLVFLLDKKAN